MHRALCLSLLFFIAAQSTHCRAAAPQPPAEGIPPQNPFPQAVKVPEGILDGGSGWFNTAEPLSLKELRGKIVVLDFWTYCCINCLHVLPDLKYLEEKYSDQLVVIGVHSAKFDNEKLADNIRDAILRHEIQHPVVNDDNMLIWQKFGTRAWPTLALIDPEGRYIGSQSGEGNRALMDGVIARLIDYHRSKGTLDETPLRFELEEFSRAETALRYPGKVLFDDVGQRLFISDTGHNRIVVCSADGELDFIIGSGQMGHADGGFTEASFDHPQGLALQDDRLFVADTENHLLRVVNLTDRSVTTLAGTGQQGRPSPSTRGALTMTALNSPWDLEITNNVLYVAMAGPHQIWSHQLNSDTIGVFAGSAREDVLNGRLPDAAFAQPSDIVAGPDGTLFVADSEGSAIRRIAFTPIPSVSTLAGTSELPRGQSLFAFGDVDGYGDAARLQHPLGLAVDGPTLFVADTYNHRIKQIDLASAKVESWVGTGRSGTSLQPVELNEPGGIAVSAETLWVADTNNHRILQIDRSSKSASVLPINGLSPPARTRRPTQPDPAAATEVADVTVAPSGPLMVQIQLNVPLGFKLNALTPVTWELFADDGQTLVPADSIAARDEASVSGNVAELQIPLTGKAAEAELLLQVSYGYCSDMSSVCRLATASWKFKLTTEEGAEQASLQLAFPTQQ
jgi:DNA-binding beta-propeller fold protein YncE